MELPSYRRRSAPSTCRLHPLVLPYAKGTIYFLWGGNCCTLPISAHPLTLLTPRHDHEQACSLVCGHLPSRLMQHLHHANIASACAGTALVVRLQQCLTLRPTLPTTMTTTRTRHGCSGAPGACGQKTLALLVKMNAVGAKLPTYICCHCT